MCCVHTHGVRARPASPALLLTRLVGCELAVGVAAVSRGDLTVASSAAFPSRLPVRRSQVIPGQVVQPPCKIPESVTFQGVTLPTPCLFQGFWP